MLKKLLKKCIIKKDVQEFFVDNGLSIYLSENETTIQVKVLHHVIDSEGEDEEESVNTLISDLFDELDKMKDGLLKTTRMKKIWFLYYAHDDDDDARKKESWAYLRNDYHIYEYFSNVF